MEVGGKTVVLGLIGDPVEHTLSPVIHNSLSRMENGSSRSVYVPFRVSGQGLGAALEGAFELGIQGLNVTVPHKSAVLPYLCEVDDLARAIGAVNTLVRTDGGYAGYNTDAEGLIRALSFHGMDASGKSVVILGAGGAARAAAFAMESVGAKELFICNRTKEKARDIADAVNAFHNGELATALSYDELGELYDRDYIALQCTSVGLYPDEGKCAVEDGEFFDHAVCGFDMIYKPRETEFMKRLKKRGKEAYNGLRMLLYQAVAAYEKFMGEKPDAHACDRAVFKLMFSDCPIALVGYMGSGKSSVGRLLADMLGCEFLDSDEEIEKREGRRISEIFEQEGEEAFRDMETEFLRSLRGKGGVYVLSTGGGMVLREENRRLLREGLGALTVYLKAEPATLCARLAGSKDRPLLAGEEESLLERIASMIEKRASSYEAAAGITVITDHLSEADVAKQIKEFEL